ncbi:DMT family transporter [Sporosarcina sp. 179-K 3D1 HS]|uniref:DMT family transporter n=1 Tax=Sporosarcina sp. 179-K 3D1 HS TaxID=3232169 RepID=UPI0039A151C8
MNVNQGTGRKPFGGINIFVCGAIIAVLLWSTSFVATKVAYASFAPLTLGAVRFCIAAIVLGLIKMMMKKDKVKPTKKDLGLIGVSGLLGTTIYFALENVGLEMTTASNAALIIASYPAITALLELFIFRIRIAGLKGIGIVLAIAGVYHLLSYSGGQSPVGEHQLLGDLILVSAGVVFAFYTFTTRKVVATYSMITVLYYQTLVGAVAFIPLAFTEASRWRMPTTESFLIVVYLGIFCSVVAFFLYNYALRELSSSTAVALMNLVPVFGVLFSVLFLGEVIRSGQLIGGALVILGVVLSVKETKKGLAWSRSRARTRAQRESLRETGAS